MHFSEVHFALRKACEIGILKKFKAEIIFFKFSPCCTIKYCVLQRKENVKKNEMKCIRVVKICGGPIQIYSASEKGKLKNERRKKKKEKKKKKKKRKRMTETKSKFFSMQNLG